MSFSLDDLFTREDVLRGHEPEHFDSSINTGSRADALDDDGRATQLQQAEQEDSSFSSSSSSSDQEEEGEEMLLQQPPTTADDPVLRNFAPDAFPSKQARVCVQKRDFISLLKDGWNKVYKEDPEFRTVHDPKNGIDDLEEQLLTGRWGNGGSITAQGRTKKLAQHKAAAQLLLEIIDSGRHKEFLIPGRDAQEARQIIDLTMQELFNPSPASSTITASTAGAVSAPPLLLANNNQQEQQQMAAPNSPAPVQQQQINWIGRLQEYVQKKHLSVQMPERYEQTGRANAIEHRCWLTYRLVDGQQTEWETEGQAKSKKQAKQVASKAMLDLLSRVYGALNNQQQPTAMGPQQPQQQPAPMEVGGGGAEGAAATIGQQQQQEADDRYALTLTEASTTTTVAVVGAGDQERLDTSSSSSPDMASGELEEEGRPDIRLLLSAILADRATRRRGAEQMLRRIIALKDSQVDKVFGQAELQFIESTVNEASAIFQCYLEVRVGPKRTLLCTFGGQAGSAKEARDDACWQAMEFLYIFGGFAPRRDDGDEEEDEG